MVTFFALQLKQEKIGVVGLGYVGLPLAIALAKHFAVVGLDIKQQRVDELKRGIDRTREVSSEELHSSAMVFTADPAVLRETKFIIVAVPTPVNETNVPDLTLVHKATEMVAQYLQPGSVVVYESTVYPGVTDEECLPILENISGLKGGVDFKVGYSPERINPGDKEHTIDRVTKIVAGTDAESLELIASVYGSITTISKAASIKVAEAAKVIENTQRDINIALMNELALIFQKMDISIYDVLAAAGTKWNFLKFVPGLVGGHCIGVDPYYLTHKAQQLGYKPKVILAGRRINDSMPNVIVDTILKQLSEQGKNVSQLQFVLLGITFKENIPDSRNSKVALIYKLLQEKRCNVVVYDPLAYPDEVLHEYGINLTERSALPKADVLIVGVNHNEFKILLQNEIASLVQPHALVVDVKGMLSRSALEQAGYYYWSL